MEAQIVEIHPANLLRIAANMQTDGCRLVQILCTRVAEGFELTYSFDSDYTLVNVRCIVPEDESITSITSQYWYAFVWENEIHDLFGLKVDFILPEVDYKGNFYHLENKTPWYDFNVKSAPQAMKVNIRSGLGLDASVKPAAEAKPAEASKPVEQPKQAQEVGGAQNG